jgi:CBS domain-containing protein
MEREYHALPIRELGAGAGLLTVADVMLPAAEVIALEDAAVARVGHVVETLRRAGRQHVLVVDAERKLRGIFSLSQVARQLGVPLAATGEVARTFAEIEAAIR